MGEIFKGIAKVKYEGAGSDNPLGFNYYNPEEMIGEQTMEEHCRFSMAYWHTIIGQGVDMFGAGTALHPWEIGTDPMEIARVRVEAAFEFMQKLNIPFFCFHDIDVAPEGRSLQETFDNLDKIVALLKEKMEETGIKLLWGTANLFGHPRFVHGAATAPNADVFAYAAARVKKALEVTKELGGENYVFWGGREGYDTLLNTDMGLELDNLARFLQMAVDYAKAIGFTGQFLIEPKPKEPTKHQYDFDVATVLSFLKRYGLEDHFKMNIEANHATLAYHSFQHELYLARVHGVLGSVDANQGDFLLGWDTDQFPTDIYATTLAMYEILKNGGLAPGGLNFDAKVRRGSFEPLDLFYAHIAGIDAFARGLKVADKLLRDQVLESFIKERYSSYQQGIGYDIVNNKVGFKELADYALKQEQISNRSGRQEMLEHILNRYLLEG